MNHPAPAGGLEVLVQLTRRARQAESAEALGFVVVNESRTMFDYRQSAVWLPDGGVVAVSGLPAPLSNAPYVIWLEEAFRVWSQESGARSLGAESLPVRLRSEWAEWLPSHAIVVPLKGPGEQPLGFWMLARDIQWGEAELAVAGELADVYGHAWRVFRPRMGPWRRLLAWTRTRGRIKFVFATIVVLALIPVHLTVFAPAEVVARDPFLVRAPIEGVVDQFHVKPNAPVKAGQPLFELDTSAARARTSIARKVYEAASEEYRQAAQLAVTDDEKGKLEMVTRRGRMAERAAELSYAEQQLKRIQVHATRDGIAVFSDANEWLGKAVAPGERVLQIADPDKVEISIRLSIADAIELAPDAPVVLYLSTGGQFAYDGALTYAAYRAEPAADGVLFYKLKADFRGDETRPRLGSTGTAKLLGERVPLIYYVLRRPIAAARQWLGL